MSCGRCGRDDGQHDWQDSDCVLPHRNHSTRLVEGAHICVPCVERHRDWLTEIVELFGTLHLVLLTGSVPDDTAEHKRPKKAPEAPAPVRLDVLAMVADRGRLFRTGRPSDLPDVPAVIAAWAQALWEALYDGDGAPDTLAGAAALLRANAERMARLPIIDEYDAELRWVRMHLRRAHGYTNPRPVGHCPTLDGDGAQCGGPLWPDTAGRFQVACGRCERTFGETMLRHLGQMLTDQEAS